MSNDLLNKNRLLKLCFIFILTLTSQLSFARSLNVGWELWFPYQYRNKAQELVGLDLEIFKSILNKANLTANYVELPWKRHLRYIKSGDMDIAFGASYTPERAQYAYFTIPYRYETVGLFVRKGKELTLKKLSDLTQSNYLIGIEMGYFYGDTFARLNKNPQFKHHINEVIDIEQNISMLLKGRIDGLLADPNTIKAFCKKYNITDELIRYPLDIYKAEIHIMLSKKTVDKAILLKFNNAIKALQKEGKLTQILNKWRVNPAQAN